MDFALMTADNSTAAAAGQQSAYSYALLAKSKPSSGDSAGGDAVKSHGSGHPRSELTAEETQLPSKAPTFLLRSTPGKPPTMLSFSSASEETQFLSAGEDYPSTKTSCYPFLQPEQKRVGPYSGGASGKEASRGWNYSSRGGFGRPSGPFTPPQWMELEHQALIYKHLVANVPIPSNLLIPITKALNPYSFSGLTSASYASNWGWGVGYGASNDPEPGRCRRTDGKKWRCSRDAVADQKYCERHINRGRHRSRKPVEGLTGRTVLGSTTPSAKVPPPAVVSCDSAMKHNQFNNNSTHLNPPNLPSTDHLMNNRGQGGLPVMYPGVSLKTQEEHKGMMGFGLQSSSQSGKDRHFMEGWTMPKDQEEGKPDWTQLSMSLSLSCSDIARPFQKATSNGCSWGSSWGTSSSSSSMGGPLGEVLNSTYGSSPRGVLGGSTFVSLSNSSSGSSPPPSMRG